MRGGVARRQSYLQTQILQPFESCTVASLVLPVQAWLHTSGGQPGLVEPWQTQMSQPLASFTIVSFVSVVQA